MSNPKTTRVLTNTSLVNTGCIHYRWSFDNGETTAR